MTGLEIVGVALLGSLLLPAVVMAGYGAVYVGTEVLAAAGNLLTLPFS